MNDRGQGASTGLEQTALGKIETGLTRDDLAITPRDADTLKRLAESVAEIAASAEMADTRLRWKRLNYLETGRPVIFCDPENGWNEIITEDEMTCEGRLARRWEMDLRKEVFWGTKMGDDKPVEPYFDVPYTVSTDDWGLEATYHQTDSAGSYVWDNPIRDYDTDLAKVHSPRFEIDWETSRGCLDVARRLFGETLTVRLKGAWWWSLGLTLPAVTLRGLNNLYSDFYENPEGLKELLALISRGHLDKLDYLEREGLLSLNNDGTYVGSGGYGFTDLLPASDFAGHVRAEDMWGFMESQETVSVSPEMYAEFIYPYEKPIMSRFGLNCYGCCEPLHTRWDVVKEHQNLRRVSCSAWADITQMADKLQDNYVFSMKPSPAVLAHAQIDRERIRLDLREALAITRGCCVEVIMKDNHTIGRRPENVVEWCQIAREEAERAAE